MRMSKRDLQDSVTESVKDICDIARELAFPSRCPICDRAVPFQRTRTENGYEFRKICPPCREELDYVQPPFCMKCGKKLMDEADVFCYDCRKREHFFDEGRSLYEYSCVRKAVARMKRVRPEYADFFGKELADRMGEVIASWGATDVIPVPLHSDRLRKRGYNQSELLAESLCKASGLRIHNNLVERRINTSPQKELSCRERQKNLKKAFHIIQNDVKLDRVILIDDIYTTGSTFDEIARTLKEAGVYEVYCLSLAIGAGL